MAHSALGFVLVALALTGAPVPGLAQERAPSPFRTAAYVIDVRVDHEAGVLEGRARLTLFNDSDAPASGVPLLLYRLMTFDGARDGESRPLEIVQDVVVFDDWPAFQVNAATVRLAEPVEPGGTAVVEVDWRGPLRGYAEVMGYVRDRIEPDFTLVRDDALAYPQVGVPSFVANKRAGMPHWDYHARITVPAETPDGDPLVVANGGRFVERIDNGDGTHTWVYENRTPAWRMDFAIAPYAILERGDHRIYHFPADSAGARRAMDALETTLALYAEWLGPLEGEPGFAIVELEDGYGAQADVSSILQPAAAFRDSTRVREIYHEIKHLWDPKPTDVSPRWNEGLATWFEYRTADALSGTFELEERVDFIADWVVDLFEKRPEYAQIPMIEYGERGTTDLAYSVAFLMFDVLHRTVGDEEFLEIVGGFYQRYAGTGASTEEFARFANETSRLDLEPFFEEWLYGTGWYDRLRAGTSIRDFPSIYRSVWGSDGVGGSSRECGLDEGRAAWLADALETWETLARDALELDPRPLPWIVVFDAGCAWHLEPEAGIESGTTPVETSLAFAGTPVIVRATRHDGTVRLPGGGSVPVAPVAATSLYSGDHGPSAFFVLSAPDVWRAAVPRFEEDPALLGRFLHMLVSHELTHTRQPLAAIRETVEGLAERHDLPETLDDDVVQSRFEAVPGFEVAWRQERDLFYEAAYAEDPGAKRALARRALELADRRRARFFVGADDPYATLEEIFLGLEGPAVWTSYRYAANAPDAPPDREAIVESIRTGSKVAWSQDEGLALFLLIDDLSPGWRRLAFGPEPIRPFEVLREALAEADDTGADEP